MDPVARRLFVSCGNGEALILDTDMGFISVCLPVAHGTGGHTAFAFHPFGPAGWKASAFFTGRSGVLDAIRMNAFVRCAGVTPLALEGASTALTPDPTTAQFRLAVVPHGSRGVQILVADQQPRSTPSWRRR